jgi:hypothetical protein
MLLHVTTGMPSREHTGEGRRSLPGQVASDFVTGVPPEARRSLDSPTGSDGFLNHAAFVSTNTLEVRP